MGLIRRVATGMSVLVLTVSSAMVLALPGVAHAAGTTLFWCNTTGTGTLNFNTASNWNTSNSCSGGTAQVPVAGNNLVFDVTNLTANETIDDDISGLSVGSVTFQGTSTNGYLYTIGSTAGNALTVTANIVNSVVGTPVGGTTLDLDVIISGSQILSDPGGALVFDKTKTLTISNGSTLNITNAGSLGTNLPILAGSGTINGTATDGPVGVWGSSPSFTGTINVASGGEVVAGANQALGGSSASTVIANGASLGIIYFADIALSENITLTGAGTAGAGATILTNPPYGGAAGAPTSPFTATLSGNVTLASNVTAKLNSNSNLVISGPLSGNYTLTAATGSQGTLTISSSNNTSKTPNTAVPSGKIPGTPDTGFALAAAHPLVTLGFSLLAAGSLVVVGRMGMRKSTASRK